ncbi:MAG: FtsX-like permease family protein [Gammaproteobacteria bacterium]|nr:FtsX-like permease family protein [Gammaproteobacteria bacterium]
MSALHRALLRDLWHLRGQVAAAALVTACGIAAFVTMLSAYRSLERARDDYYADYRFADAFAQLQRAPMSLGAALARIPGVTEIDRRIVEDVSLDVPGLAEPATGRLISLPADPSSGLNRLFLREGRWPRPGRADEAVASEAFARADGLAPGSRIGAILNGRWEELRIVGLALSPEYVYEVAPGMLFPDNRRFGVLWMDRDALAGAFGLKGAFNDLALRTAAASSLEPIIGAVDRLLEPFGGLRAYGRADQTSNRFLDDELSEIGVHATYVPAIFLGVSAFLIYMLLARLVATERGQIALLKAFGYTNARIGLHFAEFALAVVTLGSIGGIALGAYFGAGLVGIYRDYFHFPVLRFELSATVVGAAALIALGSALVAASTTVRRAVRLPPAEAMRPEPPKRYRTGRWEAVHALRRIGPSARVVLRNIARRPWRATLSVIGIAAAVATLVVGRYAFDAVDELVVAHFQSVEREDAIVNLRRVGGAAAVGSLARLPGVLRAEPFRSVPVELRFAHRHKRSVLLGIPGSGTLHRLIDAQRRPIGMPPAGIVLTRKLAEMLGARPGSRVQIEQLDGKRLRFTEPIVGVSDEPLGVAGYMDAHTLSQVLHDEGAVSGALLQIDAAHRMALFRALERTPRIAGVTIRAAALQTIREVMDRSFLLMTVVMTAFASVLVVGVVYNSARIALSERGNELASLRVLGFQRGEVARLLLGEQALLTVVAIPVGLGIGSVLCRLLVPVFDRELFRLPYVLSARTYALATLVTLAAAAVSGLLVARRIDRLDLIAVLKTRE